MTDQVDEVDEEIDTLFENEPEEEVEAEEAETTDEAETGDKPDETEETVKAEESEEAEDVPPTAEKAKDEPAPQPKLVPLAALEDVRRKTQQLAKENEELRQRLPQPDNEPDMYDDPDGWKTWNRNQIEKEYHAKQQAEHVRRVEDSRSVMLQEKGDEYLQIEEIFYSLALQDPNLKQSLIASPDPARFAYETGLKYKNDQKAAIKAELLREMGIESIPEKAGVKKSGIKAPSLASVSAAGTNSVKSEIAEDLDEIFSDQKW